ncbi:MAG: methyltransferase domain-containing protein [Candidatus Pacebacteria bacterium]|jgi:tRNA G46 methylase TrmB|nr:methyltransferase domain-containing protein [Candidatus Paceibacterota bacterium]
MLSQIIFLVFIIVITIFLLLELKKLLIRFYIALQGPFFAPTNSQRIQQILELAELKSGEKVVDLGSGDGRILIALVKANPDITAVGIELNPTYVKLSRANIQKAGLSEKIEIKKSSFWKEDLSKCNVIVTYCIKRVMGKLEKKLKNEIKESTKVISVFFQFPTWKPKIESGDIRLYQK